MNKMCQDCGKYPATVHLSSFDIDKFCDACRRVDGMRRARLLPRKRVRRSHFYYPCS